MTAGYNVYNSQNKEALSDLALDNVEALANRESGTSDCQYDPNQTCIKLHPTDPSKDEERPNHRW